VSQPPPSDSLTIAEVAARTGLTVHTLRYYEQDGLMVHPVRRTSSGQRRYDGDDLRWIDIVSRLRATGMPIREVRAYAVLCRAGDGNETERLAMLHAHRDRVLAQLAAVTGHLGAINAKIGVYEERLRSEQVPA
jgi:DNA-binding transcriptional MerR regulator